MTRTKSDSQRITNTNSDLQHLKLPPIKSTSVDQISTQQERIALPSITQLSAGIETINTTTGTVISDSFDNKLPPIENYNENYLARRSTSHPSLVFDVLSTKAIADLDCSTNTITTPQKTRNAEASARSRVKRRKREDEAKDLNNRLNAEALELEQKNQALCKELSGLKFEHKCLCAELDILAESKKMDEELLAELEQDFKWSKSLSSGVSILPRCPDPLGLAQRQLDLVRMKYQSLAEEYRRLDLQRHSLEQCLMEQQTMQLKI